MCSVGFSDNMVQVSWVYCTQRWDISTMMMKLPTVHAASSEVWSVIRCLDMKGKLPPVFMQKLHECTVVMYIFFHFFMIFPHFSMIFSRFSFFSIFIWFFFLFFYGFGFFFVFFIISFFILSWFFPPTGQITWVRLHHHHTQV